MLMPQKKGAIDALTLPGKELRRQTKQKVEVMIMNRKSMIAIDLKKDYGALISVEDLKNYCGYKSRDTVRKYIEGLIPIGQGKARRYYYEDVAERLARMEAM